VYPVVKGSLRKVQRHSYVQHVIRLLDVVEVVENKVFHTPVQNVISQDHKKRRNYNMGNVVGLIQVNPKEPLDDQQLDQMIEELKTFIEPPMKIGKIEIAPIAYGLKAIKLHLVIPDGTGTGGFDPVAQAIEELDMVESAEVVGVALL